MKEIRREREFILVPVLEKGRVVKVKKQDLFKKYDVDCIIKLPRGDFSHLKKVKSFLTHFNLQKTNHSKGYKYALALIIKPGFFDGKKQVLPVLSFENVVVAECLSVRNNVSYDKLIPKDFEYSFEHIRNVPELKKAILRRYSRSMPHLSKEEILSLGVGITKLRILRK